MLPAKVEVAEPDTVRAERVVVAAERVPSREEFPDTERSVAPIEEVVMTELLIA